MLNTHNGRLKLDGGDMYYIAYGSGDRNLIMLPGLGDGLRTVRGKALPVAVAYRRFAKSHRVYVFSRRSRLPEVVTSREMAADVRAAMTALGIERADVLGVSQGGAIAQFLAIDHPETVNRLALAVTYTRTNATLDAVIGRWLEYARRGDYRSLFIDTAEKTYTERYFVKNRRFYRLLSHFGAPRDFERFIILANACLTHDSLELLDRITCPTLILGGGRDKIVTGAESVRLHEAIAGSRLQLYEQLGHGAYEEAPDFMKRVHEFFLE